jgi:hypothetical protein
MAKGRTLLITAVVMLALPSRLIDKPIKTSYFNEAKNYSSKLMHYLYRFPGYVYQKNLEYMDDANAVMGSISSYGKLERIGIQTLNIKTKREMEYYIEKCRQNNDGIMEIITLTEYHEHLKRMGLKKEDEDCKKRILKEYPAAMKKFDEKIMEIENSYYKKQLSNTKQNIKVKLRKEGIIH